MAILRCEHITKKYGTGETEVIALNDVSFSVEAGEFIAITGASGSGKSTLLHILGGVDKADTGEVWINDQNIVGLSEDKLAIFRRRFIGLIYQFYNLVPVLNTEENIILPHLLDGRKPDPQRLESILTYLDLQDRRKHYPNQLSGGQQQRVSIGRALFTHPSILLCDEPTGNLDRKNSEEVIRLLKDSNRRTKQTILLITHDESIAMKADRIITIDDGKIVKDEPVHHIGSEE